MYCDMLELVKSLLDSKNYKDFCTEHLSEIQSHSNETSLKNHSPYNIKKAEIIICSIECLELNAKDFGLILDSVIVLQNHSRISFSQQEIDSFLKNLIFFKVNSFGGEYFDINKEKQCFKMLYAYFKKNPELSLIIFAIKNILSNVITFIQEMEQGDFEGVHTNMKIINNLERDIKSGLLVKIEALLMNKIKKFPENKQLIETIELINEIESIKNQYPLSLKLCTEINHLFPNFLCQESVNINLCSSIIRNFINNYNEEIQTKSQQYLQFSIEDDNMDQYDILCLRLLYNLLSSHDIITSIFSSELNYKTATQYFNPLNMLISISRYPKNIQLFLLHSIDYDKDTEKQLKYITLLEEKPLFSFCLSDKNDWRDSFIESVFEEPYYGYFREIYKFHRNKQEPFIDDDFKSKLAHLISSTTIIEVPDYISGITLRNLSIFIKYYSNAKTAKGCTFYTLIHELSHAVRRIDCLTYEKAENLRNSEKFLIFSDCSSDEVSRYKFTGYLSNTIPEINKEIEDSSREFAVLNEELQEGRSTEKVLFGECFNDLNESAAEFLLSCKGLSILEFQKILKEKNNSFPNESRGKLRVSINKLVQCGSNFARWSKEFLGK